jgi:hypothetical protein
VQTQILTAVQACLLYRIRHDGFEALAERRARETQSDSASRTCALLLSMLVFIMRAKLMACTAPPLYLGMMMVSTHSLGMPSHERKQSCIVTPGRGLSMTKNKQASNAADA